MDEPKKKKANKNCMTKAYINLNIEYRISSFID